MNSIGEKANSSFSLDTDLEVLDTSPYKLFQLTYCKYNRDLLFTSTNLV